MLTTVAGVRQSVHQRCLNFRALDRLVNSVAFARAHELDPNNTFIQFAIVSGNTREIEDWIDRTLKADMDVSELSMRELRVLAGKLGFLYVTKFTKDELIVMIGQKQHDRGTKEASR